MEKLSKIPWGIPNDKWIEHKFVVQSGVAGMARREIAIYSRNVVGCLKFYLRHPRFWHNQTFGPSHIYTKNEEQVYTEMHIVNGGGNNNKRTFFKLLLYPS